MICRPEEDNYLSYIKQRNTKTTKLFSNQCNKSYHMQEKMTFCTPWKANYHHYFKPQNIQSTICFKQWQYKFKLSDATERDFS